METRPQILVVDDEESIRFTFEAFLSEEGYAVATAQDFDEAIARIDRADYDLIFADIILGGRTGIDFMREIRARNIATPVVMVTGDPSVDTASEAVRLGAFDYIPKPVNQETLLHVTLMALKHRAVTTEKEQYRLNLEAIFRSVKDPIITVDRELQVVELNHAAQEIFGLDREAIGRNFRELQLPCSESCLLALLETIQKKKPVELVRRECQRRGRPGVMVISLTTSPLLDHQGNFSGAVMVIRDETRITDLERDLLDRKQFHNMIGKNLKMQGVYSLVENLADVQTTVLITGESGTGKELVAEAIHYKGARREMPLVKVNCSALSENLLESELFGHVRGAFTGAVKDKTGRFQRADGGTIFLDEIGDISPRTQLQMLRVLQEMEFERVGDSTPIKVDVRVITATNKDLAARVRSGEFREDLYYRLKVMELSLPSLRERTDDIPLLLEHFMGKFNKKMSREITGVSAEAAGLLMEYPWPGNIRELEHALEHAFVLCRQSTIALEHLPKTIREFSVQAPPAVAVGAEADRMQLLRELEKAGWNKARAARLLGIDRKTLYRKLAKYNIKGDFSD
ncbi:MAG: sigma-54-dependent Fis family transcriptional regulator [Thermodesulfovibrio sp.]|nr:sigma-54-dependent Fis family transcriptional regulator [Thermodesulfovibrio sp.]